jgi:hypothetical protein
VQTGPWRLLPMFVYALLVDVELIGLRCSGSLPILLSLLSATDWVPKRTGCHTGNTAELLGV